MIRCAMLVVSVLTYCACSALKAGPADEESGFLQHDTELTEMRERVPMHGVWFYDREDFYRLREERGRYAVAPVETAYLERQILRNFESERYQRQRIRMARKVARYMREKFIEELRETAAPAIEVVDASAPGALVLELNIVELEPSNPFVNTIGTTASFFVPGSSALSLLGGGWIAIEGRIRDGQDGVILVEFEDREADRRGIVSLRDFQTYAHIRRIIDDWAEQFAELATTPYEHRVADSSPLTLNPF